VCELRCMREVVVQLRTGGITLGNSQNGQRGREINFGFLCVFSPLGANYFQPKKKKKKHGHMRRHLTIFFFFFFFSFSDLLTDIDGKVTLTTKSKLQ
jgi:hypothetical protein